MMRQIFFSVVLLALAFLSANAQAAKPASPSSTPAAKVTEMKLTRVGSLLDEVKTSEVEPRTGKFKIGLRFLRANYSKPDARMGEGVDYVWDYFVDALVSLQMFANPMLAKLSDAEREAFAARNIDSLVTGEGSKIIDKKAISIGDARGLQAELLLKGKKVFARVFTNGDTAYVLLAVPINDAADASIRKLFDSFEFVTK